MKRAFYKGHKWSWDGKVIRQYGTHKAYDPKTGEGWVELSEMNEPLDDLDFKRTARECWQNFQLPGFIRVQVV